MFRTDFQIVTHANPIQYSSKIFLLGSCFSERIADILTANKFTNLSNPFGIIYNPLSIADALRRNLLGKWINPAEIFISDELYKHFDFHSKHMHPDKEQAIRNMNESIRTGKIFLDSTTHCIITFGTSLVYKLNESGKVVANNHKMPGHLFSKVQLESEEIIETWSELITEIKIKYPAIQFIFTVSPVRHLKDGVVENSLSKAILLQSIHGLRRIFPEIYYFPSYEIMIDDLRDYRFYESDMIHPNKTAIDYIWDKFKNVCVDVSCYPTIKKLESIRAAMAHKAFFPETQQHKNFQMEMLQSLEQLQEAQPQLDLSVERNYFKTT